MWVDLCHGSGDSSHDDGNRTFTVEPDQPQSGHSAGGHVQMPRSGTDNPDLTVVMTSTVIPLREGRHYLKEYSAC